MSKDPRDAAATAEPPSRVRRACFSAAAFVLVVLAFEGVVRVASIAVPAVAALRDASSSLQLRDADLGQRGNPAHPDHDEAGWRNALRPEAADVVALGDSQTWGTEVARELAWPQVAGRLAGRPVYNMALPGYGPLQYARLLPEALALSPELVVVAVYFGNDLYDAYHDVYEQGRAPELESADPARRERMRRLDVERPLRSEWHATQAAHRGVRKRLLRASTDWLGANLSLYGLVQGSIARFGPATPLFGTAVRRDFPRYLRRAGEQEPGLLEPFADDALSTVFTPRARLAVVDPADPRIEDGLRVLVALLARMADTAGRARIAVLLVPTKELVYAQHVVSRGARLHRSYDEVVAAEIDVRERVLTALDAAGIAWIDALPELRASLAALRAPYEMDWNGHPNAEGNAAIARAVVRSEPFAALAARRERPARYDERRSQPDAGAARTKSPSASASSVVPAWLVARTSTRRRCSRSVQAS